jgi:thioredoxin reductase (NADPH)
MDKMSNEIFDIAIVGGGPAGLKAALTGRIRNKRVALFDHMGFSQKLRKAPLIDNYLGVPQITGEGLMQQFVAHSLAHEPVVIKEKVVTIFPGDKMFTLLTPADTYEAKTVILATGVTSTLLLEGEKDFLGRGVAYCATCDGMFYRDRDVAVVSYTPEGEQEANFLAEICHSVTYLPQYKGDFSHMRSGMKIVNTRPRSVKGTGQVDTLVTDSGEMKVHGVFILRQSDPVENVLPGLELNGEVIKVNRDLSTNIPGVFAAGDCTGKPWQVAKATG